MLHSKWLQFLITLLTVFKSSGKLWGKVADQASITRLLERTNALHFNTSESENSILDNYDSRSNGSFYDKNGQTDVTSKSPTTATSFSETYFNLKKTQRKSPMPNFSTNESQSTTEPSISSDLSLQGNDQPITFDMSPDERTIQNVIRETIPRLTKKQDRWLGPILNQPPDSHPNSNRTGDWNRLEPLSPNQFSAVQQQQMPWMRVLNTPLIAKSSPTPLQSTTRGPLLGNTGVKHRGPGFRGTRTNTPEFQLGSTQKMQLPLAENLGGSFSTTTEPSHSLWGNIKTIQGGVNLAVSELKSTTHRSVLDRSNQLESPQRFKQPVSLPELPNLQHTATQGGGNNRNLMRQQAEAMMLNPLAFSTTDNQLIIKKTRPLDIQLPQPISQNFTAPPEQRPDFSSLNIVNPLQSVTLQQMQHNSTLRPQKPLQHNTGFRRRTPSPFYGYNRNFSQHLSFGSKKELEEAAQGTVSRTLEPNQITQQPLSQVLGSQRPENQLLNNLEKPVEGIADNPSLRQTTPFVCPCITVDKGTGNSYTTKSMMQAGPENFDGNLQIPMRDPRDFNQASSMVGSRDNNFFPSTGTMSGNLIDGTFSNRVPIIQSTNSGLGGVSQGNVDSVYQIQSGGINGGNTDVSRLAVGPNTPLNFGNSNNNKQLITQIPLTDIFGQPLQTTTPSQWQPFIPGWSTTDAIDPSNNNINHNTAASGANKQLQLANPNGGYTAESQLQSDKNYVTMSTSAIYPGGSATQIMDQQTVTLSYTGGQPLQTITQSMGNLGYGTSQTAASTLGTMTYNGNMVGGKQYVSMGSGGSSSTIPICPNGPTVTQPPITVDIIQPFRRRLLSLGNIAPICAKSLVEVQLDGRTVTGTIIGTVLATDPSLNTLLWSIERDVTGVFTISKFTGDFSLTGTLNGINSAEVVVRATNPAGQFCTTIIQVTVIRSGGSSGGSKSTNWFSQDVYNVTILCSLPIGTLIMQATARHPRGDSVRYLLDGTREFSVNETGFVSVAGLDVGQQQEALRSFRIVATDSQGVQASAVINVFLDVSTCYGPQFDMSAYIYDVVADCSGVRSTDQIAQINALPPSPLSQLSYRLIGTTGFLVDPMSGIISSMTPIEVSQRLPDFGIVVSDTYGRTDTATVRVSVMINCTQSRISPANDLPIFGDGIQHSTKSLSRLERQQSNIGDFLLRVACSASNGTIIGTLNPTTLLSLDDPVPDLHLENTTDFAIAIDGEIMTLSDMPSESSSFNFDLVGDGSQFGLGVIVGNITVQVVCSPESSMKKFLEKPTTTMESSTFPFIPLEPFDGS